MRALFGPKCHQVFAVIGDGAVGHLVSVPPREHMTQGAFPRAIGAHDRVYFSRSDVQVEPFQYRLSCHGYVQVADGQHSRCPVVRGGVGGR